MMNKRPNILLVVLDATRADFCSCYRGQIITTPVLDRLAAEGVLFEQAISPAPWTLPAMTSLFTGLFPSQTGIYETRTLTSSFPTLAELLSQGGYATFGITSNSWLSANFGLQRGFVAFHKQWQWIQTQREVTPLVLTKESKEDNWTRTVTRGLMQGNVLRNVVNAAFNHLIAYRFDLGARRVLGPFSRWIQSQSRPWFAVVHYLEAHLPYKPPLRWVARFANDMDRAKKWREKDQWRAAWRHIAGIELLTEEDLAVWRDLYLAEVAYADYYLGKLIDWLEQTRRLDNTMVIVTADHGENLGEHGLLIHQHCVYDTLLRVPLVIRYPALLLQGQREPAQVTTLDLFQTILDVAGVKAPSSASRNLLPGHERRPFVVAEYGIPRVPPARKLARFGLTAEQVQGLARGFTALRTETHKLIVGTDGSTQLYAWQDDPTETDNLITRHPEMVSELQDKLADWRQEHHPLQDVDAEKELEVAPEIEARLQALGYIE